MRIIIKLGDKEEMSKGHDQEFSKDETQIASSTCKNGQDQ